MPNKKLPSVYKGGYSSAGMKRLEEVKIPDTIFCDTCKKPKTPDISFSKKQIMDFKNGVATGRITDKSQHLPMWITCTGCTPKQKTEMVCIQCQQWKGLDGFTKVQRRTPDAAICQMCVNEISNEAPLPKSGIEHMRQALADLDNTDSDEDSDDSLTNPYQPTDAGDSDNGVPVPSGPSTFKLNEENLRTVPIGNSSANAWKSHAQSGNQSGYASGKTREFTGYDPHGNAHRQNYAPSVAETETSVVPTATSRATEQPMKDLTSKFAKVSAGKPKPVVFEEYVGGRAVDPDDYDSDDSNDSSGYT